MSVNMFDDEKIKLIRTLPEGDSISLIWIQMLCLAGKINDGGLVYMGQNLAYSDEMLATIFSHPVNTIRSALTSLEQFGMIEIANDGKIDILNWDRHQNIEGMERVKTGDAERQRVRYYRKKLKELGINAYAEGFPEDSETLKQMYQDAKKEPHKKPHVSITLAHGPEEEEEQEEDKDKEVCSSSTSENSISDVLTFYQNNFGVMSPYIQDDLTHWCKDLSPDLAIEAMKRAIDFGKQFNYAKGILKNWMQKNYKTLDDVEASEAQFERNKQQNQFPYKRKQKDESTPEWFSKQKEQQTIPEPVNETADPDLAANEAALKARMKALGIGGDDD